MTYEHGKADADAPVTWERDSTQPKWFGHITYDDNGTIRPVKASVEFCEIICRAFHLAKMAREAAIHVAYAREVDIREERKTTADQCTDWLRRFDAAKGEA